MMRPKFGMWSVIEDSLVIESLAAKLDFIILDLEHGFRDFKELKANFRSAQRYSDQVYVRVRSFDDSWIQALLDMGVTHFIVPQIRSVQQFQDFVKATSFPPDGRRGTHPRFEGYLERNSKYPSIKDVKRCLIIETKEAVDLIEDFCELDSVDEIYIGTYDLSTDFGINQFTEPEKLILLLSSVCRVTKEYNKPLISMIGNSALEDFYTSIKVEKRVIGIDESILVNEVTKIINQLTTEFGN
jgi:2-dehydro-3-deoxyglucarate aldolase